VRTRLAISRTAARAIARHRRSRVGRWVGTQAFALWRAYENDSADGRLNGEWRVLTALAGTPLIQAFDVGAHDGAWTQALLDRHLGTAVHCFEIEPSNRARLIEQVGGDPRVSVSAFGLASRPGSLDVWVDPAHPDMASTVGPPPDAVHAIHSICRVETGDRYLAEHGIDSVDFLKIDVEGAELDVLRGFADALADERLGAVQFEFTLWAAPARVWLRDLYDFLEPLGFSIGKIFPTYVEWRSYKAEHEVFVRANFLAVHRSRGDMLDRLQ